ncbi:MAG TPA: TRAP transporter small permease subunit [Gammaproteobacteria bacterium]|nr:TRAP transporter small permease subunit [Gammaproteobacteria bacterium]
MEYGSAGFSLRVLRDRQIVAIKGNQVKLLKKIACAIEALSEWSGRLSAWLVLLMVVIVGYDVAMRYLFQSGSVALQELEWHLFATIFLLAAAYTLKHDGHVRVDMFYQSRRLGARGRAWIDVLGCLFFLIPFCVLVISSSVPFVANSLRMGEGSPDPGGLPHRFVLKAMIIVGFALLLLQGLAMLIRGVQRLRAPRGDGDAKAAPPRGEAG